MLTATGLIAAIIATYLVTGSAIGSPLPHVNVGPGVLFDHRSSDLQNVRIPPTPDIDVVPGHTPSDGYLPLSAFGVAAIVGVGDDTLTDFTVPSFVWAGEVWSKLRVSSNGYVVVGNGNGGLDNTISNQNFPNVSAPNNMLAPFWTDLNPAAAGTVRIGTLTDGTSTWIVVDWDAVREFSTASKLHSFEMWIGVDGVEDITIGYGTNTGNGDGGFLTVGAEDASGTIGESRYFNSVGTLPGTGAQLRVFSAGLPVPEPATASAVVLMLVAAQTCTRSRARARHARP